MLRNIDDVWDTRGPRQIAAFFLVEGEQLGTNPMTLPPHWRDAIKETVSARVLNESLPHRSPPERSAIANSFLGAATWQTVCAEFDLDHAALPERVTN
jgi:hypothetical protein